MIGFNQLLRTCLVHLFSNRKIFLQEEDILLFQKYFNRGCKRNFKWPLMQRWQCPIYNGTLIKCGKYVLFFFWLEKCSILIISPWINTNEFCSYKKKNIISHIWWNKYFNVILRCKSGIADFAWKVTWNYAYSPFCLIIHLKGVTGNV